MTLSASYVYSKPSSVKDVIVLILSDKWPLSAKEIHLNVSRTYGMNVSYQAVHKSLLELEEENVLDKYSKNYSLSKNWIFNKKEFFENLNSRHSKSMGKYDIDPNFNSIIEWKFDDYSALAVTLADIFAKRLLVGNSLVGGVAVVRHAWWPLEFRFVDLKLLRKMIENNPTTNVLVRYDTSLDRWAVKEYLKCGFAGVKTSIKFDDYDNDVVVHGDSVMVIDYSDDTKKILDNFYQNTSNLADLFKEYTKNMLLRKKMDIKVKITKDPQMAEILRNKMLSYFKGDSK